MLLFLFNTPVLSGFHLKEKNNPRTRDNKSEKHYNAICNVNL